MFLRSLTIENLRSIREATISFGIDGATNRRWTFILGENGCGKSTVLRAAALVLAGSDALPALLVDIDSWIHYQAKSARISAVVATSDGEERTIQLELRRGASLRELFAANETSLSQLEAALHHTARSYLTLGYGASRRLNTDPKGAFSPRTQEPIRAQAVATLFSPEATLQPLEAWVIDMDYGGKVNAQDLVSRIAKDLMPNVSFEGIDKKRKGLLFRTPDGITPLARLSDGYQNVAAWCGDLLRSVSEAFGDYKNPLDARGLLLIDEIDLHLHPVWQRRLRGFLDGTLRNMQFVVTTHSPLTVQQAGSGELFLMRRATEHSAPSIDPFVGAPNSMMVHQLLLSPIFDLSTMDSLEVERQRTTYRRLSGKAAKSADDRKTLHQLRVTLDGLPDMAGGLTAHQARQTKVLEDIRSALQQSPRPKVRSRRVAKKKKKKKK